MSAYGTSYGRRVHHSRRRARALSAENASSSAAVAASARRPAPAQALDRTVRRRRPPVVRRDSAVYGRDPRAVRGHRRLNAPRFRRRYHVSDVFHARPRRRLLPRQSPAAVRLPFERIARGRGWCAGPGRRGRDTVRVRETPQVYAAVHAGADHQLAVRAHPHVGHDARVARPNVRGHPFLVQPHLHHLVRAAGHDVLACARFARFSNFPTCTTLINTAGVGGKHRGDSRLIVGGFLYNTRGVRTLLYSRRPPDPALPVVI